MPEDDRPTPRLRPAALAARDERERREAEALRQNLRRRKAQARLRADSGADVRRPPELPDGSETG